MKYCKYTGEDFKAVYQSDGWKIGLLRYSERFSALSRMERHHCTDEAFILLSGTAVLYTEDGAGRAVACPMEPETVYVVARDEWHHIVVDAQTTVLVLENSDTSKENTEVKFDVNC